MKLLFAKIDPAAEIASQESPFQYDVKTANYLTAQASPYRLGANEVNFNLVYGSATFDAEGNMQTFNRLLSGYITLGAPYIQQWGIDDSVILGIICEQVGTQAIEFIEGNPSNFDIF